MRLIPLSTTRRVILFYALASLITSVMMLALMAMGALRGIEQQRIETIQAELDGLAEAYSRQSVAGVAAVIRQRLLKERTAVYALVDPAGTVIAGNLTAWPPTLVRQRTLQSLDLYLLDRDRPTRVDVVSLMLPDGMRLLVGSDRSSERWLASALFQASALALTLGVLWVILGGWLLGRFLSRRVDHVSTTAQAIMSGQLDSRVPMAGGDDAFDRLAATLNRMLDRIEALILELRAVTDSLAHDLRSPIMRLSARLERMQGSASCAQDPGALDACLGETGYLLKLVSGLLAISRAEAGLGAEHRRNLDAAVLAADLVELYEPAAEAAGFALTLEAGDPAPVFAHPELLAQALSNLIENALKYAGGGPLSLHVHKNARDVILSLRDHGPGIPEAQRALAISRFGRLDPARSSPGSGLGLSLVSAIAHLHGGRLVLSDANPGLVASLELPAEPFDRRA